VSKRSKTPSLSAAPVPGAGFTLTIETLPGLPMAECRQIERSLEDHAERHGLVLGGHQLRQTVTARDHELSAIDQVTLIDHLIDVPGVVSLRVGAIVSEPEASEGDNAALGDEPCVVVRACDLALIGLTVLHRCGRITAPLYLQILGGFDRPTNLQ
jgi:hypothetical protein